MRILVIGTGSIGRRHIGVIQKEGHEIAVCDVNEASARETAEEFGIKEYYCDFERALPQRFDAALVCTPNAFHAKAGVLAMANNCHVLMEKPIAHTASDGEKLVAAAREYGKVLMVGYILRTYPGFFEVKSIIESGRLGKTVSARVMLSAANTLALEKSGYRRAYETGGGIIYDYSHEIDYLRYFLGEPKRLACFKDLRVKHGVSCDDVAEIILQFESGVLAGVHMDYVQEYGEYQNKRIVEIICENGSLCYDFASLKVVHKNAAEEFYEYHAQRDDLFQKQLGIFVSACIGENVDYVSGEDALKTLVICDKLYQYDRESMAMRVDSDNY